MNIATIITCIIVAFVVPLIYNLLQKKIELKDEYKLHFVIEYKGFRITFIVFLALTCILAIIGIFANVEFYYYIILGCLALFCILFIVILRFKVVVFDTMIIYTPSFKKTMRFNVKDISYIKVRELNYGIINYAVYIGDKKIFSLSNMNKNIQEFINMARANNVTFDGKIKGNE